MKLSQKKTCNNCKALEFLGSGIIICDLGVRFNNFIPQEPCLKPVTNLELVEAYKLTNRLCDLNDS